MSNFRRALRTTVAWIVGIELFWAGESAFAQPVAGPASSGKTKIVLVAGPPSHPYGVHEYNAGCELLARCLRESGLGIEAVVCRNGWPKDSAIFAGSAAIVFYADGLAHHPILKHFEEVDRLAKQGVGLAFLHYAVLLPEGKPCDYLKNWIGGCYELNWSVNPYWTAEFKSLPRHPITRGVRPFAIYDEWYYHMRFLPDMKDVTLLLTATPPESTRQGPDGPHSGNPFVARERGCRSRYHGSGSGPTEVGGSDSPAATSTGIGPTTTTEIRSEWDRVDGWSRSSACRRPVENPNVRATRSGTRQTAAARFRPPAMEETT